jgi:hypothetical protein
MKFVVCFRKVIGTGPIRILTGSGSRQTKMNHNKENYEEISCFYLLDILWRFGGFFCT